jgi:membrane-associated HD superfamily phosphohydrolase
MQLFRSVPIEESIFDFVHCLMLIHFILFYYFIFFHAQNGEEVKADNDRTMQQLSDDLTKARQSVEAARSQSAAVEQRNRLEGRVRDLEAQLESVTRERDELQSQLLEEQQNALQREDTIRNDLASQHADEITAKNHRVSELTTALKAADDAAKHGVVVQVSFSLTWPFHYFFFFPKKKKKNKHIPIAIKTPALNFH